MTVTTTQTRNAVSQMIIKILETATELKQLELVSLNCSQDDSDRIINGLGQSQLSTLTVLWLNDNPTWWVKQEHVQLLATFIANQGNLVTLELNHNDMPQSAK